MVERKMEKSMEEMDLEYIANSDLEWSKYKNKTIFVTRNCCSQSLALVV